MARAETRPPVLREPHSQSWGRLELDCMGRCRSRCLFVRPMTEASVSVGPRQPQSGDFDRAIASYIPGISEVRPHTSCLEIAWLAACRPACATYLPKDSTGTTSSSRIAKSTSSGTAYAAAVTSAGTGLDCRSFLRSRTPPLWCLTNGWFCDHAYACHQCYHRIHIRNVHPPP